MHARGGEDDPSRGVPSVQALGGLAVGCAAYCVAAILVLHVVQRDLDPVDEFMSLYALGRAGFLMTSWFFVLALGIGTLAVALRRTLSLHRTGKLGLVLLWFAVAGAVGSGMFRADPVDPPVTTTGVLHIVFGLLMLPAPFGSVLMSLEFRREEGWRSIAPIALLLASIFLVGWLALLFVFAGGPGSGIAQRVAIGALLMWVALVGHRIWAQRAPVLQAATQVLDTQLRRLK